ncbi:MAG TPA: response regulator [Abditibacteriaceae bacterium]|nr:response regulator [Abditibacteriaceae bacterium]
MSASDEEFLKRLQAAFRAEAEEHLQTLSSGLLELERVPDAAPAAVIESVFREAHSLKGAARAVNMTQIEAICQPMESVFAAWKRGTLQPSPAGFDVLNSALDAITQLLDSPDALAPAPLVQQLTALAEGKKPVGKTPAAPITAPPIVPQDALAESSTVIEAPMVSPAPPELKSTPEIPTHSPAEALPDVALPDVAPPVAHQAAQRTTPEKSALPETVRIATTKLDALLLQAEEMLTAKLTTGQRAAELHELETMLAAGKKEEQRVADEMRALRQMIARGERTPAFTAAVSLLDFFDWNREHTKELQARLATVSRAAQGDHRALGGLVDAMLEDTKRLLMLPFATLLQGFPRLVRDLARDEGKDVQLEMRGGAVEIDKRILEEMKDPLIHILRNSLNHGIEKPDERARRGKPARATVTIDITQRSGDQIEMLIEDDGGGINLEAVKATAIKRGLLSTEKARSLSEQEAISLIFQSDISTSAMITEISGRGLGLAIVREKVEALGGQLAVENRAPRGTTYRIALPLTLATFKGILVKAAGQVFVLPTANVERVLRVSPEDIQTIENRESLVLQTSNGEPQIVSFVRLTEALELPVQSEKSAALVSAVVVGVGDKHIAFSVEEVLYEQEVLVKQFGKPLVRVRNIAGATILGSGEVVPILHVGDLLKSATRGGTAARTAAAESSEAIRKSVLLAEDSITSRMLLKNILESAGYRVQTAVDGAAAWAALRSEEFDAVVSDIDMPRMSGLDLTEKIRAEEKWANLPIVLVTARETREDRERGIDVGASAYIVKSSFDQSNLLEVLQRLA